MKYTRASHECAVASANEESGFRTRAHFLTFCTLGCALLTTTEPLWCQSPRPPSAPKTTTQLHLITVNDRVPQDFLGHQIEDIIRVLKASGHSRPKSEFETTEVYRSRGQEFMEQLPDLFIVLRDGVGLDVTFDADLHKLTFRTVTQTRSLHEIEQADVIVLKTELVSSRQYVGTNAFGVSVRVREQRFRDLGLSIVGDGLNGHFSIPMESDRAKDLKPHVRLLLKCRVDAPLVYTGTQYGKATLSDPIEEYREGLFVDVEPTEVLLVDNRTGGVLKRFTEDDATRERIAAELRAREWQEKQRREKERKELAEIQLLETLKNTPAKPSVVSEVHPTYPSLARQARIQGTVRFNALIGKDGTVLNVTLVSGHPLLIPAAQDAVRLWKFTPGSIDDMAVEMWTVIDVPFRLAP